MRKQIVSLLIMSVCLLGTLEVTAKGCGGTHYSKCSTNTGGIRPAQSSVGGGALLGGIFGGAFGRTIDKRDVADSRRAFNTASRAPVGQTIYWQNVRTGNWGSYQPLRDGHRRFDGMYCREFVTTGLVKGRVQRVYGTACRMPNGTWESI